MKFQTMLLSLTILLLVGCAQIEQPKETTPIELSQEEIDLGIKLTEDGVKYLVNPKDIRKGIQRPGDVKDIIPSIDNPTFTTVKEANEWIADNELVLYLDFDGVKRIYPFQILVWHEIVNEEINEQPLLITYCPLCGSGIAYERTLNGEAVEFGTSGKLYNSNLVMYDRKTQTYWTQIDGDAIVGELTGQTLTAVNIDTVSWADLKDVHSDAQVLERPGNSRPYGNDPYGGYYEDDFLLFPVENEDDRIHPKDVVFGITINGEDRVYRESTLKETPEITDIVGGVNLTITRDEVGIITITDQEGNEIIKERDFWFAWYAFHPNTTVYGLDNN